MAYALIGLIVGFALGLLVKFNIKDKNIEVEILPQHRSIFHRPEKKKYKPKVNSELKAFLREQEDRRIVR